MKKCPPRPPPPTAPQPLAKLDIGVKIRFAKDATGIEITATDQDGKSETRAEVIPNLPKGGKPS